MLERKGRRDDEGVCACACDDRSGEDVAEDMSVVDVEFAKRLSTFVVDINAERAGGDLSNARSWVSNFGYVGSKNGREIM